MAHVPPGLSSMGVSDVRGADRRRNLLQRHDGGDRAGRLYALLGIVPLPRPTTGFLFFVDT